MRWNATRRFVLNATGTKKSLVILLGLCLTVSIACPLGAQAPSQSAAQEAKSLSRKEVDRLLAESRQAIESGDFAQASQLVEKAEAAGIRYPLFHFGDTPSSLRRELIRAESQRSPNGGPPTGGSRLTNALRGALGVKGQVETDPFLTSSPPRNSVMPLEGMPSAKGSGVVQTSATSPYQNFRQDEPRTLPAIGDEAGTPLTATGPIPENYPTTNLLPAPPSTQARPASPKNQVADLMQSARAAMEGGDLAKAAKLTASASALQVPESQFMAGEDRPSQLAWELEQRRTQDTNVRAATSSPAPSNRYATPAALMSTEELPLKPAVDATPEWGDLRFAQLPPPVAKQPEEIPALGADQLLLDGEQALKDRDQARALEFFQRANQQRDSLDAANRQRLDSHLKMLSPQPEPLPPQLADVSVEETSRPLAASDNDQQVLARQLASDVGRIQSESRKSREKNPRQSLHMLEEIREEVAKSRLKEEFRRQLIRRVDLTIAETEQYIDAHRAELELDERNAGILAEIDRRQKLQLDMQNKIAELVDDFNQFQEEQRYHEAEQVAMRLREIAPNEPVVEQVMKMSKMIRRNFINQDVAQRKEGSYWEAFADINEASVHTTSDGHESVYPKEWGALTQNRRPSGERGRRRSPRELEIEHNLQKPVLIRYNNEPLSTVIDDLSKATGVNMVLDPRGLGQEAVSSDTRVSLNINSEISLKSALNLILEPLHLSYVVKDEVLKITSEQIGEGETYAVIYNVADLVIPIPNFVPDNSMGLQGLINDAHAAMGYGGGGFGAPGPMAMVNGQAPGDSHGPIPETALAQPGSGGRPTSLPIGGGPGGAGGAANADFDSLIDLIISTVASDTWVENGGPEAEIRPFPTNLSLVISQTQDVHEQIADLLEQLRRLQDLQVTIEVRFIRLNDSFFERIGIDFDMNINDRTSPDNNDLVPGSAFEGNRSSSVVGIQTPTSLTDFPRFTGDLDIPFRQESFGLAVPQFGGAQTVANFGFAILSDIEAYFLIEASQGDRRSNVLNAPKVTLFNGQQAFVADTQQTPFVISVIPVVGEFAAAQQPVIVVLSEGTLMTIQAVVSDDRRYVRLTVVPFFSEIGDVQEFTFEGSTTTSSSSSVVDDDDDGNNNSVDNADNVIRSGTTVQLPTFQFVSVTTTVSVPDGGTVLLGGIKRLSEGRNEFGVPLLSKVPYINRLFRNVGIGRESDSLMMMVTPRIIIQEEEEARLLGTPIP